MPTDFVQQWLLSVQHEFTGGILLDTSYVYTRGTNLNFATDINQAPANLLGCTGYNCGNPNPIFNAIQGQIYDGWSNYNALQVRLQKRMSYGLNFLVNYAYSKSLDTGTGNGHGSGVDVYQNAYSPAANYGLSDFNATHIITGQIVYELPFGSGRRYDLHGVLNQIGGGWRVSSVFQWHTGVPFTPVVQSALAQSIDTGLDSSLGNGSTLYPDLVSSPGVSNPSIHGWFNPAAYTVPCTQFYSFTDKQEECTPGTQHFGDAGRNGLIGPRFSDVDFSISKMFPLPWEGMNLEFRADMFNVFNHVNYANPDANVGYQLHWRHDDDGMHVLIGRFHSGHDHGPRRRATRYTTGRALQILGGADSATHPAGSGSMKSRPSPRSRQVSPSNRPRRETLLRCGSSRRLPRLVLRRNSAYVDMIC